MSDAIVATSLGYAYIKEEWIFRHLDLALPKGSVFAILGPNGRGKTTFLKTLLGIEKPTEGHVSMIGQSAFVPQLFSVTFAYSVLDMVVMGRAKKIGLFSQPSCRDYDAALEALSRFGLEKLAHRSFGELSGGQRQLVIIARALVSDAQILVLDEPTSALDLKNQEMILQWIHKLSREEKMTILFTTHHPHHAYAVANRVLLMFDQEEYAFGKAEETLTEENLKKLYGVKLKSVDVADGNRNFRTIVPVFRGMHG